MSRLDELISSARSSGDRSIEFEPYHEGMYSFSPPRAPKLDRLIESAQAPDVLYSTPEDEARMLGNPSGFYSPEPQAPATHFKEPPEVPRIDRLIAEAEYNSVPFSGKVANIPGAVGRGLGGVVSGGLKGLGVGKAAIDRFLIGTRVEGQETAPYEAGKAIDSFIKEWLPGNPKLKESMAFEKVPGAVGSTIGFAAAAPLGPVGIGAVGAATEAGQLYEDAKRHGASEDTAMKAAAWGIPIGASEAWNPLDRVLNRVNTISGGTFRAAVTKLLKEGAVDTFKEAVQEASQQIGENATAQLYTDRKLLEGVAEAWQVGGYSSAIINALFGVRGLHRLAEAPIDQSISPSGEVIQTGPNEFQLPGQPVAPPGMSIVPRETSAVSEPKAVEQFQPTREFAKQFIEQNPEGAKTVSDALDRSKERQKRGLKNSTVSISDFEGAGIYRGKTRTTVQQRMDFSRFVQEELANAEKVRSDQGQSQEANVPQGGQNEGGENLQQPAEAGRSAGGREDGGTQNVQGQEGQLGETPFVAGEGIREQPSTAMASGIVPKVIIGQDARSDQIGGEEATVSDAVTPADNPEMRAAVAKAMRPIESEGIIKRLTAAAAKIARVSTRPQEHLSVTTENATANEVFRLNKDVERLANDDAIREVAKIIEPVGPKQRGLLSLKIAFDDLIAQAEEFSNKPVGERPPLRFRARSTEDYKTTLTNIDALVEKTPEVKEALKRRREFVVPFAKSLAAVGLISEESAAKAETYYRRQVFEYMKAKNEFGGGSKKLTPKKSGFQKGRLAEGPESLSEEYDYALDYVQSEAEWLTHAMTKLRRKKLKDALMNKYDIEPALRAEAKKKRKSGLNVDLRRLIPDGHGLWTETSDHPFFEAVSIPETLVAKIQESMLGEMVGPEDLKTILALGARKSYVLPNDIIKQLNTLEPGKGGSEIVKFLDDANRELVGAWKLWVTQGPLSVAGYTARNVLGDIDPTLTHPKILTYVPGVQGKLLDYYFKTGKSIHGDVVASRNLGVIQAGLSATEIAELRKISGIRHAYAQTFDSKSLLAAPGSVARLYFDTVQKLSEFRESVLRQASFEYFRDQLKAGTLTNYGGARKNIVDRLAKDLGVDVAAAHLSRNLLGDYGNITVLGNEIRGRVYPFWAWQEINLKRTPRLVANAFEEARQEASSGGKARGYGKAAIAGLSGAARLAYALSKIAGLYGLLHLFNRLMWPEEEKKLSPDERASSHLILGKNPDGSPILLRNTSSFGDMLEWLGIPAALSNLPLYQSGQADAKDIALESVKSPFNKIVQGVSPFAKAFVEITSGHSLFPDITQPRKMSRDELAAQAVGLRDVYKEVKGRVLGTGERSRANFLSRRIGVSDSRQNALSETYALREKFLASKGKAQDVSSYPPSATKVMRDAVILGDAKAFGEAKAEYLKNGHKYEDFLKSIARIDPISQRLNDADEKEFVESYLTEGQRRRVQEARDYADQLMVGMFAAWHDAPVDQEEADYTQEVDNKAAYGAFMQATAPPSKRERGETRDDFKKRQADHADSVESGKEKLKQFGGADIRSVVRKEHNKKGLSTSSPSFSDRLRRLPK